MASLSALLTTRAATPIENNLEEGEIFFYGHSVQHDACRTFCFCAPANGRAIIEAVGPGGSSGCARCCGGGLGGNSGAYSKKTIDMDQGNYICGCLGKPCNNGGSCWRGCSAPTHVCWTTATNDGCMCAEGGMGGTSICGTTTAMSRCFRCNGWCWTACGFDGQPECAIVCNWGQGASRTWMPKGYGGDVNKCGLIGCVTFYMCNSGSDMIPCHMVHHVPLAPGFHYAEEGALISYTPTWDDGLTTRNGSSKTNFIIALQGASRSPDGSPFNSCWQSRFYGCYESQGCGHWLPFGTGGTPISTCCNQRNTGTFAGAGAVRIKFLES